MQFLMLVLVPGLLIGAAASDLVRLRIPNWISIALLAAFVLAAGVAELPVGRFGAHIAVGIVALIVGFGLFVRGWVGAGDAKLYAAVALWMGPHDILMYTVSAALAGGVLALGVLVIRRFGPQLAHLSPRLARLSPDFNALPYGLALSAGALVALPETEMFRLLMG